MSEQNVATVNQPIVAAEAPVAGNAAQAPAPPAAPVTAKPGKGKEFFQLLLSIGSQSGMGFAAGAAFGTKQVGPVIGAIIGLSIVFGLEFWLRYNGGTKFWLLLGGIVAMIAAGLVPYLSMSKAPKSKGKATTVYLPSVAAIWSAVAVVFGLVCAQMSGGVVAKADALQGIMLSLLYGGVTTAAGYSVTTGTAKSGNLAYALMTWAALFIFDMAGLARA